MTDPRVYAKAIAAGLTSFGGAVTMSLADKTVDPMEWLLAVIAGLTAGLTTYAVPNKDPDGTHQDQSTQPPEDAERVDGMGARPDGWG